MPGRLLPGRDGPCLSVAAFPHRYAAETPGMTRPPLTRRPVVAWTDVARTDVARTDVGLIPQFPYLHVGKEKLDDLLR